MRHQLTHGGLISLKESFTGKGMENIQFNGQTLENLQSIIKACLAKGLDIRIASKCILPITIS